MHRYRLFYRLTATLFVPCAVMLSCSDENSPASPGNAVLPAISVNDQTVVEGSTAIFVVSLSRAADQNVAFRFSTSDGTARAPGDYTAVPLTADTIPPGSTSVAIIVATVEDDSLEQAETFYLILTSLTNATFTNSVGCGTILDNDEVSYASRVRPILMGSCARVSCHGPGSSQGGLAMDSAQYSVVVNATGNTTGGKVVVAGNSSFSTLYTKTLVTPPFPDRMPKNGPPFLTLDQQQRIRDWIDQGAKDN